MTTWALIVKVTIGVREFFFPTYRPERHYMRGPGPACARLRTFNQEIGAR